MFSEQAYKWIRHDGSFKRELQNLAVYTKMLITAGLRHRFFCDSHPELCKCCLRLRGYEFPRKVHTKRGEFYLTFRR